MLMVSFRQPSGIFDSCFNKLAARACGGDFCHAEFIFKMDKSTLNTIRNSEPLQLTHTAVAPEDEVTVALYVLWGSQVTYRVLTNNEHHMFWHFEKTNCISLNCSADEHAQILSWCVSQMGKPYDKRGALCSVVPFLARARKPVYPAYFCSQFIACALNHVLKTNVCPGTCTPNSLHAVVTELVASRSRSRSQSNA